MDTHHLRAIILKLQDRLSDNDRKRLHFFLGNDVPKRIRDDPSLSGTLQLVESLFDQDKINEQDFTFLIKAFDEIQCIDAAKLLKEHMRRIRSNAVNQPVQSLASIMPDTIDQLLRDQEDDRIASPNVLTGGNNVFASYKSMTEEKNGHVDGITKVNSYDNGKNPAPAAVSSQTFVSSQLEQNTGFNRIPITRKYLLIITVLAIILVMSLIGFIVGIILLKSELKTKKMSCLQERVKNNETIQHLRELQAKDNRTAEELTSKTKRLEDELRVTIGTSCGCEKWCETQGSPYGVCGNGPTCICSKVPITKESVGNGCTCDAWCRKHGYNTGGICGDGYTCICSS